MEMLNMNMMLGFDLWQTIIAWFGSWICNYGWAIIVFTIILKLVMIPLDVFQRISSQKQSRVMSIMQPEMQAIQAKYGNDKEKINQEQAKLYQKYKVNVGGMCLTMLLGLGVSLVVFLTLFSSLRKFGTEKLYSSYNQLDKVVITSVGEKSWDDESLNKQEIKVLVQQEYEKVSKQNSWLWVKNVWKSDTNTSQFVDFEEYAAYSGLNAEGKSEEKQAAKARYDFIVENIQAEEGNRNGYYVLIILAVLVSFLTQYISTVLLNPNRPKREKRKKGEKRVKQQDAQSSNMMSKIMLIILPVSMLFFAMSSNVVFALYIIVNSLMSAIISTIITLIMRNKDKGKTLEELVQPKKVEVVEYSRNYRK